MAIGIILGAFVINQSLQMLIWNLCFCVSQAQEEYLRAAIGNSPWPIGLTMVGIHERTGRERISTNKVAHIMNNEMQRKYLTSVKRLMRFLQDKRPDVLPSKKVL